MALETRQLFDAARRCADAVCTTQQTAPPARATA